MKKKYRYALKYTIFRFVPCLILVSAASAVITFLSTTNDSAAEFQLALILSCLAVGITLSYHLFQIGRFLYTIHRQETQHGIVFNDAHPKTLAKFYPWVVCTNDWLILPGRWALSRWEIRTASMAPAEPDRGGPLFPVTIRTHSGKAYKIKLRRESDARYIRNWAKR